MDVARDAAGRVEMVRRSGQMGVPVITVDDQVVVGFDQERLEMLLKAAVERRPSVGMSIADASRMAMKSGGIPVFGAFVGRVAPSSPAERAGIRPGDIITEANLRPISNAADLEKLLRELSAGSRLVLTVLRGDKKARVEMNL